MGKINDACIAIFLALQFSLSNFTAGSEINIFNPFRSGNHIEPNRVARELKEIEVITTTLKTPENKSIHQCRKTFYELTTAQSLYGGEFVNLIFNYMSNRI